MRWVELYHKHKALVPSSLAPVLLPVVGGAANKPVSLAAEKLLLKSRIVCFMFTIATSLILSSKLFAPSTPSFSFAPEEPPWPVWGLPNSVAAAWKRWNGVQQPLPVTRLLCCYFCAVWLWRKASSVLFTTASASWLSCNLWIHVPFELLKIIPVGGVCSGSNWSQQQGLWGLVLRAELGCHCPRSGLLWAGSFNFPSKYWDSPPALPGHQPVFSSGGRGVAGSKGLFIYHYQSHWKPGPSPMQNSSKTLSWRGNLGLFKACVLLAQAQHVSEASDLLPVRWLPPRLFVWALCEVESITNVWYFYYL